MSPLISFEEPPGEVGTLNSGEYRPGWYISRGNGVFVPLIAADELPEEVRLKGLSARLSRDDIYRTGIDQSSEYLGEVFSNGFVFKNVVDDPSFEKRKDCLKDLAELSISEANAVNVGRDHMDSLRGPKEQTVQRSPPAHGDKHLNCNIDGIGPTSHRPFPPSGREPDASRKVYCTHWIRTGECDYIQQGCYYKHEMPGRRTLQEIGFRKVPRWWQEQIAATKRSTRSCLEADGFNENGTNRDDESISDGASSTDLPAGNPDTSRWTRAFLPGSEKSPPSKAVPKEHVFGKAQPPKVIPVCGVNPKVDPESNPTSAGVRTQPRTNAPTPCITVDMSPPVISPTAKDSNVPRTPTNSPTYLPTYFVAHHGGHGMSTDNAHTQWSPLPDRGATTTSRAYHAPPTASTYRGCDTNAANDRNINRQGKDVHTVCAAGQKLEKEGDKRYLGKAGERGRTAQEVRGMGRGNQTSENV
ncbi:MAG: hypothetical protein Q9162_001381 [Coniocarpon cinnabarinum]